MRSVIPASIGLVKFVLHPLVLMTFNEYMKLFFFQWFPIPVLNMWPWLPNDCVTGHEFTPEHFEVKYPANYFVSIKASFNVLFSSIHLLYMIMCIKNLTFRVNINEWHWSFNRMLQNFNGRLLMFSFLHIIYGFESVITRPNFAVT